MINNNLINSTNVTPSGVGESVASLSKVQYITQDLENISHAQLAKEACDAGVRWIQLRVKEKSNDEYLKIAEEVKNTCEQYNATLIINDHVYVAKTINAHGVHLGKTDMPVTKARKLLGSDFIIGATANTFDDIKKLASENADYIGLGPFRFTNTKNNLSPILGLEGYKNIITKCKEQNIQIPIFAIGGITANDVKNLKEIGVFGIAVSSYITNAKNKKETVGLLSGEISRQ